MKASRMIPLALSLFLHLGYCAAETTESCPLKQHPEMLKRSYTGRYVNPARGFDVLIPREMVGRDYEDPLYQRGLVILFDDREESLIVDGEPNSLLWETAKDAAESDSSAYRDDGRKLVSSNGDDIVLNGRRAYEITTSYTCTGSDIQYSSITALRVCLHAPLGG